MTSVDAGAPVGVVGAGTMGAGIAQVAALAGHQVRLVDARPGAAQHAVASLRERLDRLAAKGHLDPAEARAAAERLRAGGGVIDLADCAVVVEAVVEDLAVKRELLADIAETCGPAAILVTNTSSLSVTAVAASVPRPERVVGLHFFNPADRMRLVEVVAGDATADAVVEAVTELARAWGKAPVHVTSTPGFIVNRVARPYYGEAQRMVEEGVADPATIDAVLQEAGGFPMGPFQLTDLVGQDVNLAVSRSVWEQTFHDPRYAPTVFQQQLVDAGRLGRKTGRGVFRYDADGRATDAAPRTEPSREAPAEVEVFGVPEGEFAVMAPLLARMAAGGVRLHERSMPEDPEDWVGGIRLPGGAMLQETSGQTATASWGGEAGVVLLDWAHDPTTCRRVALMPAPDCPQESIDAAVGLCQTAGVAVSVVGDSPGGIVARTVAMLVNEAVELVARREASAEDVDVAMLLGTGYPSGPIEWGDRLGPSTVGTVVELLHEAFPSGRYRVSPVFQRAMMAEKVLREL